MPALSVVVPTRDKSSRLSLCLAALAAAAREVASGRDADRWDLEVVVVDDGSRDATAQVIAGAAQCPELGLRSVANSRPTGRSRARNRGAVTSRWQRLLFLDDDVLADAALLREHALAGSGSDQQVVARAPILCLPWLRHVSDPSDSSELPPRLRQRVRQLLEQGTPAARRHARRSPFEADIQHLLTRRSAEGGGRWPAATGGNLSFDREFFSALGGFDPEMGLRWGVEDLELGYRAERAGARIQALQGVAAFHLDHPPADREDDQRGNLEVFARKHGAERARRLADYFAGACRLEEVVA